MKPIVAGFALVVVGALAAPLAAQQAQAPKNEPAHKIFVLTGCLAGGGPAETAPFKLTGAAWVGQAPPERTAASPDAKNEYELLPVSGLTEQGVARKELQTHVGKRVEVTVRPVEVSPGPPPSPSSTASTAKPAEPTPERFTVSQIKSLAGSCS